VLRLDGSRSDWTQKAVRQLLIANHRESGWLDALSANTIHSLVHSVVVLAFDHFRDNDTNGRGDACLDIRESLRVLMWLVNFVQPFQVQDGDGEGRQDMAAPSEEGDEGESDGLLGEQGREGGAGGRGHVVGKVQQQRQQQMGKDEMKQHSMICTWPSSDPSVKMHI
jgi:hypothetical protein